MNNEVKKIIEDEKKMLTQRLRSEWSILKSLKGEEKRQHIFTYYRFHMIILAIFLAFTGTGIFRIIRPARTPIVTIAWLGTTQHFLATQLRDFSDTLTEKLADDPARQVVQIIPFLISGNPTADSATIERLSAMVSLRDIDIIIGMKAYEHDEYQEWMLGMTPFHALRDIHAVLAEAGVHSDRIIYYIERDGSPVPRAVFISHSPLLEEMGLWAERMYFGAPTNGRNAHRASEVLRLLW
ncbi:MAG: hypothetical protein FWC16_13245 [Defluviitaleaceae bacterium]|nr:hypothetical protein [Defluviitaleaceae bacterium]MCL2275886.1 hypothetical protein [Defluviitaleaceae bacterium]